MKNTVINLSGVPLSEAESSLLDKGLSFCPTPPHMNTFQLQYDLTMFYRRLRLREYFYDEESLVNDRDTQHNPFRLRNKRWMPAKNREPALEAYIQARAENSTKTNIRIRDNLLTNERLAVRRL